MTVKTKISDSNIHQIYKSGLNLFAYTSGDGRSILRQVKTIKELASEDERIVEHLRVISAGKTSSSGGQIYAELSEVLSAKVDAAVFLENLQLKVWDKVAKLNWRPFADARAFVRGLGLRSKTNWEKYIGDGLPGVSFKPTDIPNAPNAVYWGQGWSGWGDWCGTGRLQTVTEGMNPWFYGLLKRWKERTGVPILLNTSFNDREPICETPEHAINCFLKTEIDYLYFPEYDILVSRK